eukprot:CAMPEP_0178960572 /NCGR_PEP_ID=MMETSP0789-20121207/13047_1 /TAXON_ID=3005 /ORGANISM="Rhizosolenia setigera, Strain CCMP 1694" /LENGTH=236 /DNA_ID=CAMNT_0020643953 /DNA_START=93 /DNA_END=803 /DNA_ORIENTATION=-
MLSSYQSFILLSCVLSVAADVASDISDAIDEIWSNSHAQIRGLDSSCTCSFSDLIGSDFSCNYSDEIDYYYDIPNFGETDSVCTVTSDWGNSNTWPFVSADDTSAVYEIRSQNYAFTLDPAQVVEGFCDVNYSDDLISFGCWACPAPTSFPSFVPTDSPSPSVQPSDQPSESIIPTYDVGNNDNVNQTDDAGNDVNPTDDDENDSSSISELVVGLVITVITIGALSLIFVFCFFFV